MKNCSSWAARGSSRHRSRRGYYLQRECQEEMEEELSCPRLALQKYYSYFICRDWNGERADSFFLCLCIIYAKQVENNSSFCGVLHSLCNRTNKCILVFLRIPQDSSRGFSEKRFHFVSHQGLLACGLSWDDVYLESQCSILLENKLFAGIKAVGAWEFSSYSPASSHQHLCPWITLSV